MKAAVALVLGLGATGCNDDLLGYRLARSADVDAVHDVVQDAAQEVAQDTPKDAPPVGPADVVADATGELPSDGVAASEVQGEVGEDCLWMTCNDNSPCTEDSCANSTCTFKPLEGTCEDGDLCSGPDTCAEGKCIAGMQKDCDDNQPCTLDSCEKAVGCVNKPNDSGSCKIDACSTQGVCIGTNCVGSDPQGCEADGNPCTSDDCDAKKGCTYPPKKGECDDGNGCTKGDICDEQGKCKPGEGCHVNATCKKEVEVGNLCVCNAGFAGNGFSCTPM